MTGLVIQGAAALAVVTALVCARHLLRNAGGPAAATSLELRERRCLGRESGVAVVRWRGREVLVGYGASGVTALATSECEEVVP